MSQAATDVFAVIGVVVSALVVVWVGALLLVLGWTRFTGTD